eukprot:Sspe_Gene.106018::Locus_83161_Transcript_1_8_Confidence_0.500_Length_417::g.106018::m.106018/K07304/msrA; peptide-methionine (S)-S-oxide reductase
MRHTVVRFTAGCGSNLYATASGAAVAGVTGAVPSVHRTLGTPLRGPWLGCHAVQLAMGTFWECERRVAGLRGVVCTVAGYSGGELPHPSFAEVLEGGTGVPCWIWSLSTCPQGTSRWCVWC